MTQFALFAVLLIIVAAAFLLPPLWRGVRPAAGQIDRKDLNVAIFRDQLAELERERSEGTLAQADYEQARQELQRRLLEDVDPAAAELPSSHAPTRKTAVLVLVLLPALAMAGYGLLGNPRAIYQSNAAREQPMSPAQIEAMVGKLAARLQANPDDQEGWVMLGRSYKTLGRYDEAVKAYARGEKLIEQDPDLLAAYAETIAMAGGNSLAGKPRQLVEKALKLDPNHPHSLFLAGAAAMEAGDAAKGVSYWQALLPMVEPGSDIDQMIRDGIQKMQAKAGKS